MIDRDGAARRGRRRGASIDAAARIGAAADGRRVAQRRRHARRRDRRGDTSAASTSSSTTPAFISRARSTSTPTRSGSEIFAVNVNGAFYTIRAALPALRRSRGVDRHGVVDDRARRPGSRRRLRGVEGRAGVDDQGAGARARAPTASASTACVPAGVDTPLMRSWAATLPDPDAVLRGQADMHLLKRLATADEIAAAIAFLASPAASFITGTILPVEGGATLGYRTLLVQVAFSVRSEAGSDRLQAGLLSVSQL